MSAERIDLIIAVHFVRPKDILGAALLSLELFVFFLHFY